MDKGHCRPQPLGLILVLLPLGEGGAEHVAPPGMALTSRLPPKRQRERPEHHKRRSRGDARQHVVHDEAAVQARRRCGQVYRWSRSGGCSGGCGEDAVVFDPSQSSSSVLVPVAAV